MAMLTDATLSAYLATNYRVFAKPAIDLRIGETSDAMGALLAHHGVESAVFVTAFNPFSQLLDDADNAARQQALCAHITRLGFAMLPGAGIDPAGQWRAEESVLVLGADRDVARELMTRFDQNAVVFVERDGRAQLLLHPRLADERASE